jgi:hypothetical protein
MRNEELNGAMRNGELNEAMCKWVMDEISYDIFSFAGIWDLWPLHSLYKPHHCMAHASFIISLLIAHCSFFILHFIPH